MSHDSRLLNKLLLRLSTTEHEEVRGSLEFVELDFKEPLYEQRKPVPYVYFPNSGVISTVIDLTNGDTIETGTIGREGMLGVGVALGESLAVHRAFCQVPGNAFRMETQAFVDHVGVDGLFRRLVLRCAAMHLGVIAQSAACNRSHTLEERMSRWLLMTRDRVDDDTFPLTQEFLAYMLGVRRPTVSLAGAALQKAGAIRYTRGRITILDRPLLEELTCECYAYIRNEFERDVEELVS